MKSKKAALLVYPMFCYWEIALTLAALNQFEKEMTVFALDKSPVLCEEGTRIMPDKSVDELITEEFDCILLPGIGGNPDDVIYNAAYTDFLSQFSGKDNCVTAAISLSPVLLGKAGLLRGKKFCVGMYEEDREELSPFFEYENQQRAPIAIDGDTITAIGRAFREFAVAVAEALGYECKKELWSGVKYPVNPEDYFFRLSS